MPVINCNDGGGTYVPAKLKEHKPCVLCGEPIPFDTDDCPMSEDVAEFWDASKDYEEESVWPAHYTCGQDRGLDLA